MEANSLMKIVNAIFGAFNLVVLFKILERLKVNEITSVLLIACVGSSFAVMRFSTENETYIVPILFSLLNSFYFLKYLTERKNSQLLESSLFGAIACLFHQIHFFWWFGIFVSLIFWSKSNFNKLILYALPALIVPLTYVIVLYVHQGFFSIEDLIQFIFREFYRGNVDQHIGVNNFILTIISFVRTFMQAHGNMYLIINQYLWFLIPGVITFILFFYALTKVRFGRISITNKIVFYSHGFIFILQLLFAFYSVGNAEFMVMLPFLVAVLLGCLEGISQQVLLPLTLGLFIWNLSYGILPNHYLDYSGHVQLINKIKKNKEVVFVLNDKLSIENEFFYRAGKVPQNLCYCPSFYLLQNKDTSEIFLRIKEALKNDSLVVTDCIGNKESFNRQAFLKDNVDKKYFSQFNLSVDDSINTSFSKKYLYQLTSKSNH
jgi:hypothetical protein